MPYTIAKLAKAADVHVEAIRYYHRRGLLAEPYRPTGRGSRQYEEAHAHRLRFIALAQALGFDLDEVVELLALERRQPGRGTKQVATRKLAIVPGASRACAVSSRHWPQLRRTAARLVAR